MKKLCRKNGFSYCVGGGAGWSVPPPPKTKIWEGVLVRNRITDVFDITYDIGDFKAHISCPHQTICYLKSTMNHDRLNNCLLLHCSQIEIFTLDTVKITKRFACVKEQHAQQTGALPTELTKRWSNLGSGSHGQLFRPYWGSSAWHSRRLMNGENPCITDLLMSPRPPNVSKGSAASIVQIHYGKFLFYGDQQNSFGTI